MASECARGVVEYLGWWDYMLWRESHRLDPTVEWARDLSWDGVAGMAGVPAPMLRPGEVVMNVELGVELYWPGEPPSLPGVILCAPARRRDSSGGSYVVGRQDPASRWRI